MKKILILTSLLLTLFSLLGCFGNKNQDPIDTNKREIFGHFAYRDNVLYSFKDTDIDALEAKNILANMNKNLSNKIASSTMANLVSSKHENLVNSILLDYRELRITSKFWNTNDGIAFQTTKTDRVEGTDLKNLLLSNEVQISPTIRMIGILVYQEIIDDYEGKNAEFRKSEIALVSPFSNVYTYHKSQNNFVLRTYRFSEIPSSEYGGASASFIQENETIFNYNGTANKFQSSLGISLATNSGTAYEGTIFEISFEWIHKN